MDQISLTLQTIYQDLLQAHLDKPPREFIGAPHLRHLNGKPYWYSTVRGPGGQHQQKFIGPDNADTRSRIETWKNSKVSEQQFRALASEKTRALRAARLPALDMTTGKVLRALAQAGTFQLGSVLVGTHAFRLYDYELGVRVSSAATAITADIDIAAFERLSLMIEDHSEPDLPSILEGLGMLPVPSLQKNKPVRWRMPNSDFVLDFLAPSFGAEDGPRRLEALGLWAQGLKFMNYLIRDPVPAVALYREGILLQIPSPERYAIHKLIVSTRRSGPGRAKSIKDLAQAKALIGVLSELRPGDLSAAYAEAREEGSRWQEALDTAIGKDQDLIRRLD